jgi:hypothetical protein
LKEIGRYALPLRLLLSPIESKLGLLLHNMLHTNLVFLTLSLLLM